MIVSKSTRRKTANDKSSSSKSNSVVLFLVEMKTSLRMLPLTAMTC